MDNHERDRSSHEIARAVRPALAAIGREHGATVSELNTDSRTGALGLYEKVGMRVVSSYTNYVKDLG